MKEFLGLAFMIGVFLLGAFVIDRDTAKEHNEQANVLIALNYPPTVVEQVRQVRLWVDIYSGCIREPIEGSWRPHLDLNGQPVCLTPEKDGITLVARVPQPK
jgi:hypothetical protein